MITASTPPNRVIPRSAAGSRCGRSARALAAGVLASLVLAGAAQAAPTAVQAAPSGPAAPGAATAAPRAVEVFAAAVRDGSPTRLLQVWPRKGTVELFGKKVDYQRAAFKAKFDDGVFELLRWPKAGERGVSPGAAVERSGRGKRRFWTLRPEGHDGPVCTLRSLKGQPAELISCVERIQQR